ncbi:uncharacterized protein LOC141640883 [Silene latifolia]|uniref:uncharacterized protein LOC141640883 n=1 Tax=Silene latifolia TaxID=37657 RepID=UPI003D776E9A
MKIDLKKAYDSIEWIFVEDMLIALKFPTQMVNWIMQCVTTPSYTLSLNGSQFGYVKGRRGLRQGDPLSPLLFTLCLEYFTRILAMKGDVSSVKILMRAMLTFSLASGLTINSSKLDVYMNGLPDSEVAHILNITGFKQGSFPFHYLGVDISYKRLSDDEYHRAPAVSWESCCQDKTKGGLGVANCYLWNVASIAKNSWWIANKKDSLWVCWVHHIYIKQTDWWNYSPTINSSWVWRQISKVKNKLKLVMNVQHWLQKPFSSQITYECLMTTGEQVTWGPFVWNRLCSPKVNFIICLFAKNRLLTKQRVLRFGVLSDGLCCICAAAQKSQEHLLFGCHFNMQCLQLVSQWLGMNWSSISLDDMLHWKYRSLLKKQVVMACIASLIYSMWACRNSAKHDGCIPRPAKVLQQVQSMVKFWLQVIHSEGNLLKSRPWLVARNLLIV